MKFSEKNCKRAQWKRTINPKLAGGEEFTSFNVKIKAKNRDLIRRKLLNTLYNVNLVMAINLVLFITENTPWAPNQRSYKQSPDSYFA